MSNSCGWGAFGLLSCVCLLGAPTALGGGELGPFIDVTDQLGLADQSHRHFGACLVDANADGWIDVYYANGLGNPQVDVPPSGECPKYEGEPPFDPASRNTFYLNRGDGTFTTDLAPEMGIDDFWNAMRHVWGDYDNDGRRDLISHNFLKSTLYHAVGDNDGQLLFVDANRRSAMELCLTDGTGASWADLNHDGFLDLYAVEYDQRRPPEEHVSKMFLNNGDGTFTEITDQAGVNLPDKPMGIALADYDNDGDQDIYVTNSGDVAPSRLYRHDGVDRNGIPHFTDVAQEAGVAVIGGGEPGIGAAWGDYNNDGRFDLLFARVADTRLFRNDGPDEMGVWTFTDVTNVNGFDLADEEFWDGTFADLDNDGWLDVVLANRDFPDGPNRVFRNNTDETWTEMGVELGLDLPDYEGIGIVPGDIDNDGDLDLVFVNHTNGDPNFVFRNDHQGANWIQFRLTGVVSNRDAVGARITITTVQVVGEEITQIREVIAGTGFFSDVPRIQTFGLGQAAQAQAIEIRWPNGAIQQIAQLEANQRYDFIEPSGILGDLDGDGVVSATDLILLLGSWGACDQCADCLADLDDDCLVGTSDLVLLLGNWG